MDNKNILTITWISIFPALFYNLWVLFSIGYIEINPIMHSELGVETHNSGAFAIQLFLNIFYIIGLYVVSLVLKYKGGVNIKCISDSKKVYLYLSYVLFILSIIYVYIVDFSNLYEKSQYRELVDTSIYLLKYQPFILFICGFVYYKLNYFYYNNNYNIMIYSLILILVSKFLAGHKFSGLVDAIFYFSLGGWIGIKNSRYLKQFFTAIILVLIFSSAIFFIRATEDFSKAGDLFADRILTRQGGLAWGITTYWLSYSGSLLNDYINYVVNSGLMDPMSFMMELVVTPDKFNLDKDRGVVLTGTFPSIFLLLSSSFIIDCMFAMIFGLIAFYSYYKIILSVTKYGILGITLTFFVYIPFIRFTYSADPSFLFTYEYYVKLALYGIFNLYILFIKNAQLKNLV